MRLFGREIEFEYNESMILCVKLSLIAAQTCAVTLFCDSHFRVSRRLANAGYCAWILTLASTVLTLLLLVEIKTDIIIQAIGGRADVPTAGKRETGGKPVKKKHVGFKIDETDDDLAVLRTPEIFEAVNYNGMTFFLFANLLTGIVNMSLRTLYVVDNQALQILFGYITLCLVLVVVMYRHKVQMKL